MLIYPQIRIYNLHMCIIHTRYIILYQNMLNYTKTAFPLTRLHLTALPVHNSQSIGVFINYSRLSPQTPTHITEFYANAPCSHICTDVHSCCYSRKCLRKRRCNGKKMLAQD